MPNTDLFIKMVLDSWNAYIKRTDELFESLSDEDLEKEVSANRNRGIYLLGHLAAVHDRMLPLLELGESKYEHLYKAFLEQPDRANAMPEVSMLRTAWKETNRKLEEGFKKMNADKWFERHTAVSPEDFAKEPHRNKLNLVINRTGHLASHYGQLLFLTK